MGSNNSFSASNRFRHHCHPKRQKKTAFLPKSFTWSQSIPERLPVHKISRG